MRESSKAMICLILSIVLCILVACHPNTVEFTEMPDFTPTKSHSSTVTLIPTKTPFPQVTVTATFYPTVSPTPILIATSTPSKTQTPVLHTDTPKDFDVPASEIILGDAIDFSWDGVAEFSPDNRYVVLARDRVNIWDTDTHKLQYLFRIPYQNYGATQVSFNADTSLIAVSSRCRLDCTSQETHLMIWDLRNKTLLHDWIIPNAHMEGPHDYDYDIPVNGLSFYPEGDILAYAIGHKLRF